jgi:hypothetical protein
MKQDKMLKKVVKGVLLYWIIFVAITWITFWVKDAIPDTLVSVGLGGGAFELLCTTIVEVAHKKFDVFGTGDDINDEGRSDQEDNIP